MPERPGAAATRWASISSGSTSSSSGSTTSHHNSSSSSLSRRQLRHNQQQRYPDSTGKMEARDSGVAAEQLGAFPRFDSGRSASAGIAAMEAIADGLSLMEEHPIGGGAGDSFDDSFGTFPVVFESKSPPSNVLHHLSATMAAAAADTSSRHHHRHPQHQYLHDEDVVVVGGNPDDWFARGFHHGDDPEVVYHDRHDTRIRASEHKEEEQQQDCDASLVGVQSNDGCLGLGGLGGEPHDFDVTGDSASPTTGVSRGTTTATADDDEGSVAEGALLWRIHPKHSYSDWLIVVTCDDASAAPGQQKYQQTSYHVHKALLASGPRRSLVFRSLFQADDKAPRPAQRTDLKLPLLSAQAFPLFLDLLYDPNMHVDHADEGMKRHVVALHQLAETYQVAALLHEIATRFVPRIDLTDADRYYNDAVFFDPPCESVLDHIMMLCTRNVLELDPASPLLRALEPDFLLGILETERRRRETRVTAGAEALHVSRHLSKLIVGYVAHLHAEQIALKDETLDILTRKEYIPSVDFDVVLEWARGVIPKVARLTEPQQQQPHGGGGGGSSAAEHRGSGSGSSTGTSNGSNTNPATANATPSNDPALSLQLRCLDSMKMNISRVDLDNPASEYRAFLKSLPPPLAVDAVLELISLGQQARQDVVNSENGRLRERNAALEAARRQYKSEIHSLSAERDELKRDLGRFELVVASKKSALKKISSPPSRSGVPPGVKVQTAADGGGAHMQCAGRLVFSLAPPPPPPLAKMNSPPNASSSSANNAKRSPRPI